MREEIHKRFMELGLVDKPEGPKAVKLINVGEAMSMGMPGIFTDEGRHVGWVKRMDMGQIKDPIPELMNPQRNRVMGQRMTTECVFNIKSEEVQALFGQYLFIYEGSFTSTAQVNKRCIGVLQKMESNIDGSNSQLIINGTVELVGDVATNVQEDLIGPRDRSNDIVMPENTMIPIVSTPNSRPNPFFDAIIESEQQRQVDTPSIFNGGGLNGTAADAYFRAIQDDILQREIDANPLTHQGTINPNDTVHVEVNQENRLLFTGQDGEVRTDEENEETINEEPDIDRPVDT